MSLPIVDNTVLRDREVNARLKDLAECVARTAIREHERDPDDCPPEYVEAFVDELDALVQQALWMVPHEELSEWSAFNEAATNRMRAA